MNFGEALEYLKSGHRIRREGWNGKGMYLYLTKGLISIDGIKALPGIMDKDKVYQDGVLVTDVLFDLGAENTPTSLPVVSMRTASGAIIDGWLASQTDLMAEDWVKANLDAR